MKEKIGEQYIRLDLLSFEQAELILEYQKEHGDMKFGDIAVYLGFLDEDQVGNSLKE
ncbi:MAG: hypothetical protein JXR86_11490 [Spirochaetales bacterium]|nr:hypothetical protein [Spirochaetales bacterium]